MKEKNTGVPINQEEIYHYLKDIRKIKVMTPDREKELAVKMKSDQISDREKDLTNKVALLEKDLELEKLKTSNSGLTKLYDQINNLESMLEIERNRNKTRKEQENPFGDKPKSSINWVSKEDRNKNIYGE